MSNTSNQFFFFQAEDGIRDYKVTGVQTCALPISCSPRFARAVCARIQILRHRVRRERLELKMGTLRTVKARARSEERRVGKESRCRWGRGQKKKKKKRQEER